MMKTISAPQKDDVGAEAEPNSVYMMAHSGARGCDSNETTWWYAWFNGQAEWRYY